MKRMMILVALLMAAIVVFSGPVAQVLDLPEPTAEAKKKKKRPAYNLVRCPNSAYDNYTCNGTARRDRLVGGPASRVPNGETDYIYGREGGDVYNGGGGGDVLTDNSTTSNDRYLFPSTEFSLVGNISPGWALIQDFGGSADVLGLGSYKSTDFARSRFQGNPRTLRLDGPGARDIHIYDFFTTNSIDSFKFSDRTVTADEIKSEFP